MKHYVLRLRSVFGTLFPSRALPQAGLALPLLFTATMFLSATLLFVVQPLFARMILPLLGGSPAVWNTAQVFYQVALLLGYLYAHLTRVWLTPRQQIVLHAVLLLVPLLVLPIAVPAGWQPPTTASPVLWLFLLLAVAVGLPFFVVSTSSPLLQSWFARTNHPAAHDPYFLYAASNVGSMLALLAYPFVIEPRLRLVDQSRIWSIGYGVLVVLVVACAAIIWRTGAGSEKAQSAERKNEQAEKPKARSQKPGATSQNSESSTQLGAPNTQHPPIIPHPSPLTPSRCLRWVLLAAAPSSLLLSVTTYLSSNIAPFPLLWIGPLALYLLTFILVFATRPLVPQWLMLRALPIVLTPLLICLAINAVDPIRILFPLNLVVFFVATMVCHGELAADRPDATHLTAFYLFMSFGGALGGILTAMVAPLVFNRVLEYPLALILVPLLLRHPQRLPLAELRRDLVLALVVPALCLVLAYVASLLNQSQTPGILGLVFGLPALLAFSFSRRPVRYGMAIAALFVVGVIAQSSIQTTLYAERSFFGINRVVAIEGATRLVHGTIVHGQQSTDPKRRLEPLTYYHRDGPLGQVFERWGRANSGQRVAVVGLGVGSTACYAQPGQTWTFYEIDPVVEQIARDDRFFTFLRDCTPDAQVVLGDARLKLADAPDTAYDMLVLDAYSSDAIPTHLITREAMELYQAKLASGGIVMFHISNRYLDLRPVLARLADDVGMTGFIQRSNATAEEIRLGKTPSIWVALARTPADLAFLSGDARWQPLGSGADAPLWTDDFYSILDVFHW